MQYRLRTLLILMAIGPPLIGFWPAIKKRAIARAAQVTSLDVAVAAAATSIIALRVRLHFSNPPSEALASDERSGAPIGHT
jgi:hypothetical protein